MQQTLSFRLKPSEAADHSEIINYISKSTGHAGALITGFHTTKKSIDARGRQTWINLTLTAFIGEPFFERKSTGLHFPDVSKAKHSTVVIGSGPCGLFAALKLVQHGIRPIILERGKDIRSRRRDLAALNKEGIVNPESNYCFGEGGAGTYSDGKLYTRSSKRGDISRILELLFLFGAPENILYEAHPHIGTNKLPAIIAAIRNQLTACGAGFHFEKKVVKLNVSGEKLISVVTSDGDSFAANDFILATGHSARDIFTLLHENHILIEAKPFALGVRIEHPQQVIDNIQYHCASRGEYLPPASYSLVEQVSDRGVFSFCMCPGGIIAPASTSPGELVVNGWSPSKRNNPYANSGMVVEITAADIARWKGAKPNSPLDMMHFQQEVEQSAFRAGGGKMVAPAQRMNDFIEGKLSGSLPDCSYVPGIHSATMSDVLPSFVYKSLQEGFKAFGRKMRGYLTNEAVVLATESRTSSPVRIPRDAGRLHHPQIKNLYPAGEGAGYAGGIVSAAMDGERIAAMIASYAR